MVTGKALLVANRAIVPMFLPMVEATPDGQRRPESGPARTMMQRYAVDASGATGESSGHRTDAARLRRVSIISNSLADFQRDVRRVPAASAE